MTPSSIDPDPFEVDAWARALASTDPETPPRQTPAAKRKPRERKRADSPT